MNIKLWSFSGFYESRWFNSDGEYYALKDMESEHNLEHIDGWGVSQDYFRDVAIRYAKHINEYLEDLGLDVKLTFDKISSPREYNFYTDSIMVDMIWGDDFNMPGHLLILMDKYKEKLSEFIAKYHTSYDGFWSTMDNEYDKWVEHIKGMDEYVDERYVGCLLTYLIMCDNNFDSLNALDESIYIDVMDWDDVYFGNYLEPQSDEAREEWEEYQKQLEYKAMLERDQLSIDFAV